MKILFIRHGETDWNKNHKIQGTTDIPLNNTGIKTSKESGIKLNKFNIAHAYASPLSRAIQTCKLMLEGSNFKDIEIKIDERVKERAFGNLEGFSFDEYFEAIKNNKDEGVETEVEVFNRVKNFFKECYLKHKDETIAVVSHGGCIRLFLQLENLIPSREIIKTNPEYSKYKSIHNNSIHEIEYDGSSFILKNFDI